MPAASAAGAPDPVQQCLPRQRLAASRGGGMGGEEGKRGGGSGGKEKNRAADAGPPAKTGARGGREKARDTDDTNRENRGSGTRDLPAEKTRQAQNGDLRKKRPRKTTRAHGRNSCAFGIFSKN